MFRFGLSQDGKTFTAERFDGYGAGVELPPLTAHQRLAVVCDVETTGLDHATDEVIEIAARKIVFDKDTGEIEAIGPAFEGLQQPSKPLSPFVSKLTGLTDERLQGQSIFWQAFDLFISDAAVIIAHNCAFDRPFIEKASAVAGLKIWACSDFHLDWRDAHPSASQPFLALFHGFFYESHRALIDVDALIKLLGTPASDEDPSTYLYKLLQNAKIPACRIYATDSKFETKDVLRSRRYRWDNDARVWSKLVRGDRREEEETFLANEVYGGKGFLGRTEEIPIRENFRGVKK